ncbi:MAG: GntR family transcriptional regulator [Proteobacteria bacterium]|nr:GntR family transcriptional regulator [Pseudomonadota bacterium]
MSSSRRPPSRPAPRPAAARSRTARPAVPPAGSGNAQRDVAWERFRQQILAARLRPGQFVSQRELMTLLDMPLAAVREMIPRLEAARLLVTVPKRGLQIAPVDLKLIRNAFQVRSMIEREAVQRFVREVSDEEIDRLEQAHREILARAERDPSDASLDADALQADWGLHDRMVDAMGNEILSEIYRVNSLHVRLIRLDAAEVRPRRTLPAMQEHLAFLAALRSRDEARAVAAIQAHIDNSRQRVVAALLDSA